jgi:secreted trypsin-like serine protease
MAILLTLLMMLTASLAVNHSLSVASGRTFRQSGFTRSEDERTGKTPAQPGAQPWMVVLVDADEPSVQEGQFCGASLISPQWVLTAAHCVEDQSPDSVDVVVGRYQLSSDRGERIGAKRIIPHPGYVNEQDGQANDIALIELSRSATAGQPISIIGVANASVDDPGVQARVAGWGRVPEKGLDVTDKMYSVDVPVVTEQACQAAHDGEIQADELCAGLPQGGADSCEGDSGGPLFVPNAGGKAVQIGIVSWGGDGCGLPQSYGVYTRLTEYEQWIKAQMGAANADPAPAVSPTPASQPSSPSGPAMVDPANIALPSGYVLLDAQNKRGEREAYFETRDGDYVDVSVFEADYSSLAEWKAEQDGEAVGQIIQVRGLPVLVEDGSDRYGPFWYATFVIDGQLVFIDGALAYDELLEAAASLID